MALTIDDITAALKGNIPTNRTKAGRKARRLADDALMRKEAAYSRGKAPKIRGRVGISPDPRLVNRTYEKAATSIAKADAKAAKAILAAKAARLKTIDDAAKVVGKKMAPLAGKSYIGPAARTNLSAYKTLPKLASPAFAAAGEAAPVAAKVAEVAAKEAAPVATKAGLLGKLGKYGKTAGKYALKHPVASLALLAGAGLFGHYLADDKGGTTSKPVAPTAPTAPKTIDGGAPDITPRPQRAAPVEYQGLKIPARNEISMQSSTGDSELQRMLVRTAQMAQDRQSARHGREDDMNAALAEIARINRGR